METKTNMRNMRILGVAIVFLSVLLVFAFGPLERRHGPASESAAVGSLRTLNQANLAYANAHRHTGYPGRLSELSAGSNQERRIDPVLASGEKGGYKFTYVPKDTTGSGMLDAYQIFADPLVPRRRHFF